MGAGCVRSTGELRWETSFFSSQALTGTGNVGQSSRRLIPRSQLWQPERSLFILFLTRVKMYQSEDLGDDGQTRSMGCFWGPCHEGLLQSRLISLLDNSTGWRKNCRLCPEVRKNVQPLFCAVDRLLQGFLSVSFLPRRTGRKTRCTIRLNPGPSWKVIGLWGRETDRELCPTSCFLAWGLTKRGWNSHLLIPVTYAEPKKASVLSRIFFIPLTCS